MGAVVFCVLKRAEERKKSILDLGNVGFLIEIIIYAKCENVLMLDKHIGLHTILTHIHSDSDFLI